MKIHLTLLFTLGFAAGLSAQALKKVMVLDFKNILKHKEYDYLENSITEAVNNSLKDKFAFQETRREVWEEVAKENFISTDDLFTYTAAMNLGLYARQDVVIFGGFTTETPKGKSTPQMNTRVRILDVGKKKEIADFTLSNPIDNTIFDSVDKIAARIVKEAAAVLPSKEDAAAGRLKKEIPSFSQFSIRGMYVPLAFSSNQAVATKASFAGTDFSNQTGVLLDYHYFGIFHENLGFFGAAGLRSASNTFEYKLDNSPVNASLQSLLGSAGFAWRQKLGRAFYLQPWLGGGAQYDSMAFDYKSSTVNILDANGNPVNRQEYTLIAPFAATGLRGGFQLNKWLTFELGLQYAAHFFSGEVGHSAGVDLGVGLRL